MSERSKAQSTEDFDRRDAGMRERLKLLLHDMPQAEVARRTGIRQQNIHRYLTDTRIPVAFCGLLAEKLNLNPAWLISGEGAPKFSDVSEGTKGLASSVLDLVQAMNAVAKMRLGSLTAKDHLKVLRELNDALIVYENLKEKLNVQTRPVLKEILERFLESIHRNDFPAAESLERAALQVSRLCEDEDLAFALTNHMALYQNKWGSANQAFMLKRKAFQMMLGQDRALTADHFKEGHNYSMALWGLWRAMEARRCSRAMLAMTEGREHELVGETKYLKLLCARCDAEIGNIREAQATLEHLVHAYGHDTPFSHRYAFNDILMRRGLLSAPEMMATDAAVLPRLASRARDMTGHVMLVHLALTDDRKLLEPALALYRAQDISNIIAGWRFLDRHIAAMLDVLAGTNVARAVSSVLNDADLLRYLDSADFTMAFPAIVCRCHILRLGGRKDEAIADLMRAERLIASVPREVTPRMMWLALHYRNAIELLHPKPRTADRQALLARAMAFFPDLAAKGYEYYAEIARAIEAKLQLKLLPKNPGEASPEA